MSHHDLEIIIKGKSQDFFAQDLHTKAVPTLIEEADVGGWECTIATVMVHESRGLLIGEGVDRKTLENLRAIIEGDEDVAPRSTPAHDLSEPRHRAARDRAAFQRQHFRSRRAAGGATPGS